VNCDASGIGNLAGCRHRGRRQSNGILRYARALHADIDACIGRIILSKESGGQILAAADFDFAKRMAAGVLAYQFDQRPAIPRQTVD
jgi:hypothetical protein